MIPSINGCGSFRHNHRRVAHPNHAPILANHAVFRLESLSSLAGFLRRRHDRMIFRVNVAYPFPGICQPLVRLESQHRFHLRAHVQPLALHAKFRNVTDCRYLFDQGSIFRLGLFGDCFARCRSEMSRPMVTTPLSGNIVTLTSWAKARRSGVGYRTEPLAVAH